MVTNGFHKEFPNGIYDDFLVDACFEAAKSGRLGVLREIAWSHPDLIRCSLDSTGSTCLHVAAAAGHLKMVHWLATEAGCDCGVVDTDGNTASDVTQNPTVRELLLRLSTIAKKSPRTTARGS
jgi:hypothetical protein